MSKSTGKKKPQDRKPKNTASSAGTSETRDVRAYLTDDGGLTLPIGGEEWVFQPLTARWGLKLQAAIAELEAAQYNATTKEEFAAAWEALGDSDDEIYERLLGDQYASLLDGASFVDFRLATSCVMLWNLYGLEYAVAAWESEGKARPRNRAQRRA